MVTAEPIAIRVTRYRCPFCARSHSSRSRAAEHLGRCWRNPEARGCKTCRWFDQDREYGESCAEGVDLTGRPECARCAGTGTVWVEGHPGPLVTCEACGGNAREVKPGPIVHCDQWEIDPATPWTPAEPAQEER